MTLCVVTALVAGALWLGANVAMDSVRATWHERQLNALVDNVIHRAELAIDHVILAKVDLVSQGLTTCHDDTVTAVREAVYRNGSLVDIHIRTPETTCQAFEGIGLDSDAIAMAKEMAIGARNSSFRLMQLADGESLGLGVVWSIRDDHFLTAIARTDALLFDMLPAAVRDVTSIVLSLSDGSVFARFPVDPADHDEMHREPPHMYVASSTRFPIQAELAIPASVFAAWGGTTSPLLQAFVGLVSVLLGWLVARGLVRPPSEREALQAALRDGEIVPYFQPVVSLSTGQVVGCEVLARWIKPDGTQISPGVFIPLAELAGQSDAITRTLMCQAGDALGDRLKWQDGFKLNVNVTATQLVQPGFADSFVGLAMQCGLSTDQLVVELIERETVDCMADAKAVLGALQCEGVRVAIDDVGTGQNGLALLQGLGADIVKIDKLFIDMIDEDSSSRMICEMLVKFAHESNMIVVAEGIEREEQVASLQALGIDEAQGFYFARPVPAEAFLELLDRDAASRATSDRRPGDVAARAPSLAGQAQKAA